MSRSGYTDDLDAKRYGLYRGRVASAIRGKRGQRLLRDGANYFRIDSTVASTDEVSQWLKYD